MGIVNDLRKWLLIPGTVTTYTSPTVFTSLDFAGMINDSLIGYWVVVLSKYNGGAFGTGAPKYEGRMITDYDTSGAITHNAFSVILALGDEVLIVSPLIYETMTIKGGGYSIQDIMDEHAAELDLAEVRTIASPVTLTAAVQYIYQNTPGTPFLFTGGFMNIVTGAWATLESVTITVDVMIDGVNWRNAWTGIFSLALGYPGDAAHPIALAVPSPVITLLQQGMPQSFDNNGNGVRVGIVQTVEGAAYHTWAHSFLDAVRGS
jgi:hypothetical protein